MPDERPCEVVDLFPQEPPPSLRGLVRQMVEAGNVSLRLIGVVGDMRPARGAFAWPPPPPKGDDPPNAA